MKEKTKAGGQRAGAGRKKIEVKKVPVTIYILPAQIDEAGGREVLRTTLVSLLEKHLKSPS